MRLVSAFILSRLDYCNAVLAGLPKSTIAPLQRAQNAATWLVTGTGPRDHVTPVHQRPHWLPVQHRITYKLCLLMNKMHTKWAPSYLIDRVTATAEPQSSVGLCSTSTSKYQTPRTSIKFGEHGFSYAGPLRGILFQFMYNIWWTSPHSRES